MSDEVDTGCQDANGRRDAPPVSHEALAEELDGILAHLWMVRTFVKHAPEVEDYPELMQVVRTIFDASRAVETRRSVPTEFLKMARKKRSKLKAAADQFRTDAPLASDHTNFKQAVRSLDAALCAMDRVLAAANLDKPH
jgi:hypothetical protein